MRYFLAYADMHAWCMMASLHTNEELVKSIKSTHAVAAVYLALRSGHTFALANGYVQSATGACADTYYIL